MGILILMGGRRRGRGKWRGRKGRGRGCGGFRMLLVMGQGLSCFRWGRMGLLRFLIPLSMCWPKNLRKLFRFLNWNNKVSFRKRSYSRLSFKNNENKLKIDMKEKFLFWKKLQLWMKKKINKKSKNWLKILKKKLMRIKLWNNLRKNMTNCTN